MKVFTCERCNQTYTSSWTEDEAKKEFENAMWNIQGDNVGVLCDICFEEFKKWFEALTEDDYVKMLHK